MARPGDLQPAATTVPLERIVELLAPALDREKSLELVNGAVSAMGLPRGDLAWNNALGLLMHLGSSPGVVGVAARLARTRLLAFRRRASSGSHEQALPVGDPDAAPPSLSKGKVTVEPAEIANLLSHTIGKEKSEQIVKSAMEELGMPNAPLDQERATALLDALAKAQGIVGVSARFAKARLILRFQR